MNLTLRCHVITSPLTKKCSFTSNLVIHLNQEITANEFFHVCKFTSHGLSFSMPALHPSSLIFYVFR